MTSLNIMKSKNKKGTHLILWGHGGSDLNELFLKMLAPMKHVNSFIQVLQCASKSCEPCELQIQRRVVNTAVKSSNQSLL